MVCVCVIALTATAARADDRASAREHYLNGKKAFELGSFDEAIREYMAAYRLKDDPALLYNLGQANRLANHPVESLHFYKVYLLRLPNATNRDEVETKIAELEKLVDQQKRTEGLEPNQTRPLETPEPKPAPPPAQQQPPPPPPPKPSWSQLHPGGVKQIAGIALGAVGVGALVVGIAYGVLAKNNGDELTRLDRNMQKFDPSKQSAGKTDQVVSGVMLGLGAATAAGGALLIVLGRLEARRAGASERASITPIAGPGLVGAAFSTRF
jgi:hypothetical protein